jgi:hypothetical protein
MANNVQSGSPSISFLISRWIFLRLLGVVYLAAFSSLWVQIEGLVGSNGILPIKGFLATVKERIGWERLYLLPTLCWADSSDLFLNGLCIAGVVLSCLLIVGVAPALVLFLLWALYLSLAVAGQIFLGYQWDALLLETGLLAVFLAPYQLWPRFAAEPPPSRAILWLFRWLLFRLIFASGVVKLMSGDQTWRHLTALQYHYYTQPLPTWTSWYMHQLPGWFQQLSVIVTFIAELLVPVLIFGPRLWRYAACAGIIGFQLLIAATGNYGFFNLLSIALCLLLLDDGVLPERLRARIGLLPDSNPAGRRLPWPRWLIVPVASVIFIFTAVPFLENCGLVTDLPEPLIELREGIESFHSFNRYGLFAVMTTRRPEIIVEGSNDGETWIAYEFKWKPGEVSRRPGFTTPHMPRLDWQMWFAALGNYQQSPWFMNFQIRLLQGSPEVLKLMEMNPFPDRPPRYVRAVLYEYYFTDSATRKETGAWWRREFRGPYGPELSLRTEPQ